MVGSSMMVVLAAALSCTYCAQTPNCRPLRYKNSLKLRTATANTIVTNRLWCSTISKSRPENKVGTNNETPLHALCNQRLPRVSLGQICDFTSKLADIDNVAMAEELEALSVILPRLDGDQVETIFRAGMLDLMGSADDIDEDEVVSMLSAADVDAGKPMKEVMRAAQFLLKEASEFELTEEKVKKNLSPLGFSVAHASAVYKIMGEAKQKKTGAKPSRKSIAAQPDLFGDIDSDPFRVSELFDDDEEPLSRGGGRKSVFEDVDTSSPPKASKKAAPAPAPSPSVYDDLDNELDDDLDAALDDDLDDALGSSDDDSDSAGDLSVTFKEQGPLGVKFAPNKVTGCADIILIEPGKQVF